MKNHLIVLGVTALLFCQCKSGLVTMSNGCYNLINEGQAQNKSGNYTGALDNFDKVLQKCDAYDAKEKGYAGRAAALNGLSRYNEALDAANKGLAINKSSLDNLYERANAELELGRTADAKADLSTITSLTGKNKNVAQRATIYSKMAEVDTRQQQYEPALDNIHQAIAMDNNNPRFYKQETAIITRMYQQKYKTTDAGTLSKKISSADRQTLCNSISTAKQHGVQDMGIDLVQDAVCK